MIYLDWNLLWAIKTWFMLLRIWAFFKDFYCKFYINTHLWKGKFWEQTRGNSCPKKLIRQSRLRNKYLKEKSANSKIAYDIQKNYCVNLLPRAKKKYFVNINISSITLELVIRNSCKLLNHSSRIKTLIKKQLI